MHKIYTAAQAQQTDEYTINTIGIPSLVLMERAALGVTKRILEILKGDRQRPVICVCGKGNNGADGLAVARQLSEADVNVSVYLCGSSSSQLSGDVEKNSMIAGEAGKAELSGKSSSSVKTGKKSVKTDNEQKTDDFGIQLDICRKTGIPFMNKLTIPSNAIIAEGIFGNGLDREVGGVYKDIIKKINSSGAYVVSIDIPAGVNAATGEIMGIGVNADETVTFGAERTGHILCPGAECAGKLSVVNIGWQTEISEKIPDKTTGRTAEKNDVRSESMTVARNSSEKSYEYYHDRAFYLLDDEDLKLLPPRPAFSHKGTFGNTLVVAGSWEYGGAAVLCAKAAYMTGARLVRVYTHEDNRSAVLSNVPEAIVTEYEREDFEEEKLKETLDTLKTFVKKAGSIVVGPGLGKSEASVHILKCVLENAACTVILDADALNIISDSICRKQLFGKKTSDPVQTGPGYCIKDIFLKLKKKNKADVIITPHIKEAALLLSAEEGSAGIDMLHLKNNIFSGADTGAVSAGMPGACLHLHDMLGVNVVLKSAVTVMTDGRDIFINKGGNSGMACGGSGDVLAGLIGGLAAQGIKGNELMRLGVYLHSKAGELARERYGEPGMLPSDVALCVRDVLKFR